MHVTFPHAGIRDSHEYRSCTHLVDVLAPGITHRGTQATRQLMQDLHDGALVGYPALYAFRNQLLELRGRILEVTVRRAVTLTHGAERAHAAIGLVGGALVQLDLSG